MEQKEKVMDYIRNYFNVDVSTIEIIEGIYDYLSSKDCSKTIITYNDNRIAIDSFIYTFIDLVNNGRIDLNIEELLANNIIDMECL
jgi:hypothetical protein